ncbi:MAG: DegV family protein [Oscillospiraceae bacterium]|nr:DegV family protein [Oscillospiraceae bacterium]
MKVQIISDSTCDLSPELIKKYGVRIVPLHIVLGDVEHKDGETITPDEIYKWSDENKATPKTSALGIETVTEVYKEYLDGDTQIVIFSISGHMSTTVNVMRMAAEELGQEENVFVIDSQNLSTGIGLQVIEAAIMAQNGKSASEIYEHIMNIQPRVRASFVVDTLTYLHRGGRCSSVAALAGSALKLHPRIAVNEGKMSAGKKYRGKIESVIMDYVKELEPELRNAETDRVFITHSGCDEALLKQIHDYIESLGIFGEILTTRAGCVISSHCGPNTLGVLFISK